MAARKLKPLTQQDIETAIKKLLRDQEEYYAEWLSGWVAQIDERSEPRPKRDRNTSKRVAA